MLEELKKQVCEANKDLVKYNLVVATWGNVSAIDLVSRIVAIKPSGVSYDDLKPKDIVLVDLNGVVVEGDLNPSSDTKTHLEIYKKFIGVGSIVHTHSTYATSFGQSGIPLRCFGTTHADHFYGTVPIIPPLPDKAIKGDYERNTGISIVNFFEKNNINYLDIPGCVVFAHGPFVWGRDTKSAVYNALAIEKISEMNYRTIMLNRKTKPIKRAILDKHFLRKNGKGKYYGQK